MKFKLKEVLLNLGIQTGAQKAGVLFVSRTLNGLLDGLKNKYGEAQVLIVSIEQLHYKLKLTAGYLLCTKRESLCYLWISLTTSNADDASVCNILPSIRPCITAWADIFV